MNEKMRIAKAISTTGYCSRRNAETLILEGKVSVNRKIISHPAFLVNLDDDIYINKNKLDRNIQPKLWIYYKPKGLITTHKDPQKRDTVFEQFDQHLISVGRLDINSEGLLLLTNHPTLAHNLEKPSNKIKRYYKVRGYGEGDIDYMIKSLKKGITINKIYYAPVDISIIKNDKHNKWFNVILSEGKNREIRKIFEHFGFSINRLIRYQYGPFKLQNLKPTQVKEINYDKFKNLCCLL